MPCDDEKRLVYFDQEEHLVRWLDAAVISSWTDLPADPAGHVAGPRGRVVDTEPSPSLHVEMKHFIAANT